MDAKLQQALKRANVEIEKAEISDPELRKIAFSKAIDFYLKSDTATATPGAINHRDVGSESGFWQALAMATGYVEKRLKDIFAVKDKQVRFVMSTVPGESRADKQRNLSALVLLAYQEGFGDEWTSSILLAEAAKHSDLYDTSKFARNLKSETNWFRVDGTTKGQKYRLSAPGTHQAKSLLATLLD